MITADRLREVLHYDPETGVFTRLITTASNAIAGNVAGSYRADGYLRISVDYRSYLGHRLAWLFMTGAFPPEGFEIDHKDGDPSNNRWENLRQATASENRRNSRRRKGRTLPKGVSLHTETGRFIAQISADGAFHFLGRFVSADEAQAAYLEAAKTYHGEFARAG